MNSSNLFVLKYEIPRSYPSKYRNLSENTILVNELRKDFSPPTAAMRYVLRNLRNVKLENVASPGTGIFSKINTNRTSDVLSELVNMDNLEIMAKSGYMPSPALEVKACRIFSCLEHPNRKQQVLLPEEALGSQNLMLLLICLFVMSLLTALLFAKRRRSTFIANYLNVAFFFTSHLLLNGSKELNTILSLRFLTGAWILVVLVLYHSFLSNIYGDLLYFDTKKIDTITELMAARHLEAMIFSPMALLIIKKTRKLPDVERFFNLMKRTNQLEKCVGPTRVCIAYFSFRKSLGKRSFCNNIHESEEPLFPLTKPLFTSDSLPQHIKEEINYLTVRFVETAQSELFQIYVRSEEGEVDFGKDRTLRGKPVGHVMPVIKYWISGILFSITVFVVEFVGQKLLK